MLQRLSGIWTMKIPRMFPNVFVNQALQNKVHRSSTVFFLLVLKKNRNSVRFIHNKGSPACPWQLKWWHSYAHTNIVNRVIRCVPSLVSFMENQLEAARCCCNAGPWSTQHMCFYAYTTFARFQIDELPTCNEHTMRCEILEWFCLSRADAIRSNIIKLYAPKTITTNRMYVLCRCIVCDHSSTSYLLAHGSTYHSLSFCRSTIIYYAKFVLLGQQIIYPFSSQFCSIFDYMAF